MGKLMVNTTIMKVCYKSQRKSPCLCATWAASGALACKELNVASSCYAHNLKFVVVFPDNVERLRSYAASTS